MNIPFHKPCLDDREIKAVQDALSSGWLTMGPKTIEFENRFREFIGAKYAISCNSATAALHLSLLALDIGEKDEVILPVNTFTSTAEVVLYTGATPVLCDIDQRTHNVDPEMISELITPRTKAIIPVHFAGIPCDMTSIMDIAKEHSLFVVEDAAHALPSTYEGKSIGNIGTTACFSFYATKTMTTGEGGMVTTDDSSIAEKIKIKRLHGISGDAWNRYSGENDWFYDIVDLGFKYNTTDLQSALGLVQLEKIQFMQKRREEIANMYLQGFSEKIKVLTPTENVQSSWHLFIIKVNNRDELHQMLKRKGIHTSVHFIPLHHHSYYQKKLGVDSSQFTNANQIYNQSLSLPIYPGLQDDEVGYIIDAVLEGTKNLDSF